MLRLISYLAPSIPAGFYETAAGAIRQATGLDTRLLFEERVSGPMPGDENPFANGSADIGFICAPTYKWCLDSLELLPVPLSTDVRAQGRAIYFADVVVHAASDIRSFTDLRGRSWAYNDRNSLSGWFSMLDNIAPEQPGEFFADLRPAGSHLASLELISSGSVDAAGIDSNALRYYLKDGRHSGLRVIDSLGPFPIQPVVIRASIHEQLKADVRQALLGAHELFGEQLRSYGFERFIAAAAADYE